MQSCFYNSQRAHRLNQRTSLIAGAVEKKPVRLFNCVKNIQRSRGRMDIDLIFKIAAVGIIVSILNQVLVRSGREEQATMTTLAGLVVVLMIVVQRIADLFELVKNLFQF